MQCQTRTKKKKIWESKVPTGVLFLLTLSHMCQGYYLMGLFICTVWGKNVLQVNVMESLVPISQAIFHTTQHHTSRNVKGDIDVRYVSTSSGSRQGGFLTRLSG